eukprot:m51a1_g11308 hypothetical protein (223) ;mRNA; r:84009-88290
MGTRAATLALALLAAHARSWSPPAIGLAAKETEYKQRNEELERELASVKIQLSELRAGKEREVADLRKKSADLQQAVTSRDVRIHSLEQELVNERKGTVQLQDSQRSLKQSQETTIRSLEFELAKWKESMCVARKLKQRLWRQSVLQQERENEAEAKRMGNRFCLERDELKQMYMDAVKRNKELEEYVMKQKERLDMVEKGSRSGADLKNILNTAEMSLHSN